MDLATLIPLVLTVSIMLTVFAVGLEARALAADITRTVALEPTLRNVLILGLVVIIRTFLRWGLVVEIEGRWPWQARAIASAPEGGAVRAADQERA
jgi:hypothetical protein